MMESTEDGTDYIAVKRSDYRELLEATRDYLGSNPDPEALLRRWLSLELASTVVAFVPGATDDSQAQITALVTTVESLQRTVENMESQHLIYHDPAGKEYHPDYCRECRVDRIMFGVTRALAEVEIHLEGPETPPVLMNFCRRVARYLTDYRQWRAPVEPESKGLKEIRELISPHVKLDGPGAFPWQSTIEGVKVLLGDLRSMSKTIKRRGMWQRAAEAKLVRLGQPITPEEREEFADSAEQG